MFRTLRAVIVGLAVGLGLAPLACPQRAPEASGVVVDSVGKAGAAARAGLLPGDVLVSWRRYGDAGKIESIFDLAAVESDDAGRGGTTLTAARGRRRRTLPLPAGEWRLEARPALTSARLARHEEARRLVAKGEHAEAADAWRALADEGSATASESCWFLIRAGEAFVRAKRPAQAEAAFALARARVAAGDVTLVPAVWELEGDAYDRNRRSAEATHAYREAITRYAAAGRPTPAARGLSGRGLAKSRQTWLVEHGFAHAAAVRGRPADRARRGRRRRFSGPITWARPVREDLVLLEESHGGIQSLLDSLGGVPGMLGDLSSTKASQTSVDAVAAAVDGKSSQQSVNQLFSVLEAIQVQVGSMQGSVLGVLNNHSSSIDLILANQATILANQTTLIANQAIAEAKLDRLLKGK